ncbi:MAG TPA: ABC transporter permease, partial [Myxococcaceae bacterium]|nr:ABC transporter permease [Myxococcaceae bacterium]
MPLSRLRSAVRPLLARPAFSAVVVLTLALGIGLNTAIYTVVDAALIRTLPFGQPDRLVKIDQIFLEHPEKSAGYSWPGMLELRDRTDLLSGVAAYTEHTVAMHLGDRTELIASAGVTGNFLQVLGARPLLGRDFGPTEEGLSAPHLAIITHALWRERFGSDPGVIGRSLTIDGEPTTVVGVLRPDFRWPGVEATSRASGLPQLLLTINPGKDLGARRNATWLAVIGRLRDGVSLASARTGLDAFGARLRADFPED